ncbi:MAG: hypothetical protein JSV64_08450 [Candidatus Bathyarchaeota archaeon]|nr:MAG: hypothetical protein JSV64_08450 [Candidatus Bathyarchaeota archaeon]
MARKAKKELQHKISEADRYRRAALAGLILSAPLIILGILLSLDALLILGYAIFITCTAITSFFTAMRWQYAKTLRSLMKEAQKTTSVNECPRCGTRITKHSGYCRRCGKKINVRARTLK